MFMSCEPQAAAPTTPDPGQDRAAASPEKPSRAARLLSLVRKLIDYGKEVAHDLQQNGAGMHPFRLATRFDTADVALILARIARGLRLAAGLETRLISHPPREEPSIATGASTRAAGAAAPRPPRTALPAPRGTRLAADPRLAALPSAEEIAAECRRRPIGAVLADICRDLGITVAHPLWRELNLTIMETGGNATALLLELFRRGSDWLANSPLAKPPFELPPMPPGWKPPPPLSEMDWATGPPGA
jgi:hypothetical protein